MNFYFFLVYFDNLTIHIVLLLAGFLYWINNRQHAFLEFAIRFYTLSPSMEKSRADERVSSACENVITVATLITFNLRGLRHGPRWKLSPAEATP